MEHSCPEKHLFVFSGINLTNALLAVQLTEGELKPGAERAASAVEGGTRELTEEHMVPAARTLADQAVPLAERTAEDHLMPAARKVADQVGHLLPT